MCLDGEASQWQCGKTGFLCCAKPGCPVIVSRRHAVSICGTRMKFKHYVDSHGDLEESKGSDSNNELDLEEMDVVLGAVQLPDGLDAVLWESPQDEDDSSENGSMLEGNGESIFVSTSLDQDLQCTEAYEVDDKIDPDDENVVDPPSELASPFYMNAAHQLAPIWCTKMYISGYIVVNGVGSCLIQRNQPIHPSRYQSAFLEGLVCTSEGHSVPLMYPEGMMFPSIFWKDTIDSSLIGAIPSSLLTDYWQCRKHHFVSLMDHLRSRINNPLLRTSTDPYYIFHAFDCFANINLCGEDSHVVLSRGFVESQGGGGIGANRSKYFNIDSIDSRLVMNQLSTAIAEESLAYFYTQSCNQKDFYGVHELK
jgi:hypothetical protein